MNFVPSSYQTNIVKWATNPKKKNGICNAVAGSGKSSTLKLVAISLHNHSIDPKDIKIVVFGKQNQLDLQEKFGNHWHDSITTLHSLGYKLLSRQIGKIKKVDSYKYKKIGRELGLLSGYKNKGSLVMSESVGDEGHFKKLFNLARFQLSDFSSDSLRAIAQNYALTELYDFDKIAEAIHYINQEGIRQAVDEKCIDYSDMIYLPICEGRGGESGFLRTNFVLLDECQDLNLCQIELIKMLLKNSGRLLAVGDPNQAIFGFAGAGVDSYYQVQSSFNAVELPLSICYRCPTSHIRIVNRLFSKIPIEPSPNAIEGIVRIKKEEDTYHKEGDLIIARKTATLIKYCLKLISQGLPAKVKGRNIGENLTAEIDRIWEYATNYLSPEPEIIRFIEYAESWQDYKGREWCALDYGEKLIEMLDDKIQAILTIWDSLTCEKNIKALKQAVQDLFTESEKYITLCTVHRAKGLEADRVFILEPNEMPLTWENQQPWELKQERNLIYVALTRSKSELYLVGEVEEIEDLFSNTNSNTNPVAV